MCEVVDTNLDIGTTFVLVCSGTHIPEMQRTVLVVQIPANIKAYVDAAMCSCGRPYSLTASQTSRSTVQKVLIQCGLPVSTPALCISMGTAD